MDLLPPYSDKKELPDVPHRGRCHPSRAKLFLVSIVSFFVASLIVLLVALTRVDVSSTKLTPATEEIDCLFSELCNNASEGVASALDECPDWAIIGAGFSGTYAAWRIRDTFGDQTIALFEPSDTIGGRGHTSLVNGSLLEYGLSYFVPEREPLVNDTVYRLGLESEDYLDNVQLDDILYHFRGTALRESDLGDPDRVPYNMDPRENGLSPYELCRLFIEEALQKKSQSQHNTSSHLSQAPRLDDMLDEFSSPEAASYIRSGLRGEHLIHCNPDVLLDITKNHGLTSPFSDIMQRKRVKGGMSRLPEALLDDVMEGSASIELNSHLDKVVKGNNYHLLHFNSGRQYGTKMTCAKSLIITLPPALLQSVSFEYYHFSDDFTQMLESSKPITSTKVFVGFSYRWWRTSSTQWRLLHTDLSLSIVEEVPVHSNTTSQLYFLCITLTDPVEQDKMHNSITSKDTRSISRLLRRVSGMSAIPDILRLVYRVWDNNTPLWYSWKPGEDWDNIRSRIMQPLPGESIYVVGSAWAPSSMQHDLEGDLWTVEQMMAIV